MLSSTNYLQKHCRLAEHAASSSTEASRHELEHAGMHTYLKMFVSYVPIHPKPVK
jgi:hypothetical protein